MIFDFIEWDDANLDHATRRLSAQQIEQAIWNATVMRRHRRHADRALIVSTTDDGMHVTVVVQIVGGGVRPIAAWEV